MDIEKDELNTRLEMRLGEELRNQLDRQVGRAAPYFLKRCTAESECRRVAGKQRARLLAGLVAVAAAFWAVLVGWERSGSEKRPDAPRRETAVALPRAAAGEKPAGSELDDVRRGAPGGAEPSAADEQERSPSSDPEPAGEGSRARPTEPFLLGRTLKTRTRDEGTLLVGQTPMRKVRRQWLERVEWFDPQNGARVQRIVPREEILFVPLPIN